MKRLDLTICSTLKRSTRRSFRFKTILFPNSGLTPIPKVHSSTKDQILIRSTIKLSSYSQLLTAIIFVLRWMTKYYNQIRPIHRTNTHLTDPYSLSPKQLNPPFLLSPSRPCRLMRRSPFKHPLYFEHSLPCQR